MKGTAEEEKEDDGKRKALEEEGRRNAFAVDNLTFPTENTERVRAGDGSMPLLIELNSQVDETYKLLQQCIQVINEQSRTLNSMSAKIVRENELIGGVQNVSPAIKQVLDKVKTLNELVKDQVGQASNNITRFKAALNEFNNRKRPRNEGTEMAGKMIMTNRLTGREKGAIPGEFITPITLLRYMKERRRAMGLHPVNVFTPKTMGYIPFTVIRDGVVKVNGGVSGKQLSEGVYSPRWGKGCGLPLSHKIAMEMYSGVRKAKRKELEKIVRLNTEVKRALNHT